MVQGMFVLLNVLLTVKSTKRNKTAGNFILYFQINILFVL